MKKRYLIIPPLLLSLLSCIYFNTDLDEFEEYMEIRIDNQEQITLHSFDYFLVDNFLYSEGGLRIEAFNEDDNGSEQRVNMILFGFEGVRTYDLSSKDYDSTQVPYNEDTSYIEYLSNLDENYSFSTLHKKGEGQIIITDVKGRFIKGSFDVTVSDGNTTRDINGSFGINLTEPESD